VVVTSDVVVTGGGCCVPSVVDYNNLVELSGCPQPQGTLGIDNARGGQGRSNLHSDLHLISCLVGLVIETYVLIGDMFWYCGLIMIGLDVM